MTATRGFLLGKFMPLHEGHLFMCEVARARVDHLTVLLCSRTVEPISGALRETWLRESLPSDVTLLHLTREDIPQEPCDHSDFWDIWHETINGLHPAPIDVVFGSELYIHRLAKTLHAKAFLVDEPRTHMPISASEIRNDPAAHWRFVPPAVRPYYQKRLCLLGPESVGKTQLASHLAADHKTIVIPEYGRDYDATFKQGKGWGLEDFQNITAGHQAFRHALSPRGGPLLIEDTDYLQTRVWARYLLTAGTDLAAPQNWRPADHYLLLAPTVAWENDGTRYCGDDEIRQIFFTRLRTELEVRNLPHTIIDAADWSTRTHAAKAVASTLAS